MKIYECIKLTSKIKYIVKFRDFHIKNIKCWTGGVAQAVDCLFCMHEALRSNPSSTKKKENHKMWEKVEQKDVFFYVIKVIS
jgi:hypothetical protein